MFDLINGFDLVGMVIGVVEKRKVIIGKKIRLGDVVIGIKSLGIYFNGFIFVRKFFIFKYGFDYEYEGKKFWEWFFEFMRIYVKVVFEFIENVKVYGLVYIIGGGFFNFKCFIFFGFFIEMLFIEGIFRLIYENGVFFEEMFCVFNMGVGMVVVVLWEEKEEVF